MFSFLVACLLVYILHNMSDLAIVFVLFKRRFQKLFHLHYSQVANSFGTFFIHNSCQKFSVFINCLLTYDVMRSSDSFQKNEIIKKTVNNRAF